MTLKNKRANVGHAAPKMPKYDLLVEPLSVVAEFGLPNYRPGQVYWSKVSDERLLEVTRDFASRNNLPVKDKLIEHWSGLVFELKKRGLFKNLTLGEITPPGSNLSDIQLASKPVYPFILRAALYDPDLAHKTFPISKKGYRQFRYVSDSHLYSVAIATIANNPQIKNISAFVKFDSPFGEELIRRGLDQYIRFESSGKSKRKFKRRPTKSIVKEIQAFVDQNHIEGIVDLKRYDSGYFRIYYERKLTALIKFHEKTKYDRSKPLDDEKDEDDLQD